MGIQVAFWKGENRTRTLDVSEKILVVVRVSPPKVV